MTDTPAIDIRGVTLKRVGVPVLASVDLRVARGVTQVITGPSGAGKTTLLKVLCGLLHPDEGTAEVLSARVGGSAFTQLRPHIGYIPQTMGLVQLLSAEQNVLLGCLPHMSLWRSFVPVFSADHRRKAQEKLDMLGLLHKASVPAYRLSGGEKRRVAIARTLMQDPVLLLADEILSDLDFVNAAAIMDVLHQLKHASGLTIMLVEHDLQIARQYADCVAIMRDGQLRAGVDVSDVTHEKLHTFFG